MTAGPDNPYRPGSAALAEPTASGGHLRAWFSVLLALLPLGIALLTTRQFANVFTSFSTEIPPLTRLLLEWPIVLALPGALMAAWRLLRPRGQPQASALFALGLGVSLVLSLATLFVFYLPILRLASMV